MHEVSYIIHYAQFTSTECYTVEKPPFARRFECQVSSNKVPWVSLQAGTRLLGSPMSVIGGVRGAAV